MWILISWLQQKPADLDLHSLQKSKIYLVTLSRTSVRDLKKNVYTINIKSLPATWPDRRILHSELMYKNYKGIYLITINTNLNIWL